MINYGKLLKSEVRPPKKRLYVPKKRPKSAPKEKTDQNSANRALKDRLATLPGWLPSIETEEMRLVEVGEVDKPWYEGPGKESVEYYEQVTVWKGGWHALTTPDLKLANADWAWVKVDQPSGGLARYNRYRLWAAQCSTCRKYTVSTSTNFLRGTRCGHCHPIKRRTTGANLYLGGTVPSDGKIHLIRAANLEAAQATARAENLAWVIHAYAGRGARYVLIPTLAKEPTERPEGAWAFAVGDVPPCSEYSPEPWPQAEPATYWEGPDGRTYSWYVCPVETLYSTKPVVYKDEDFADLEPSTETPPPTLNEAGHVAFDDFF